MTRARVIITTLLAAACAAAAGCGDEEESAMKIDWDLAEMHTLDQVGWPEARLDSNTTRFKPVDSVRIELPAKRVLSMPDRASDVILYRRSQGPEPLKGKEGEILEKVEVYGEPMGVEDAYDRGVTLAKEFDVPRAQVDSWRERRDADVDPVSDRTYTSSNKPLGGTGGPIAGVEFLYSANDQRPWIVMVSLYWPPPREG